MKHALLSVITFISFCSTAQFNLQWQELGPDNMGGNVTALILDKRDATRQTLYAGVMGGGIWKTTDGANWWTYLGCAGNYAVNCMVQAADGSIYFGTGNGYSNYSYSSYVSSYSLDHRGNGIYKIDSVDNISHLGSTTTDTIGNKWEAVNRIAVSPSDKNKLIAATKGGLWKTNDAGSSWQEITIPNIAHGQSAMDVKWSADGNLILATVGGNDELARSLDGGNNWTGINNVSNTGFPGTQGRIEIAIAPSNSNVAYVNIATVQGATYGVWRTLNAGTTWDTIAKKNALFDPFGNNVQGWYDNALGVSPIDSSKIFIGGVDMYTYSPTTGMHRDSSFTDPFVTPLSLLDLMGYVINDLNPDEVYAYSDRGVYKSTNANTHFTAPDFYSKNYQLKGRDFFSVAATKDGRVMGGSHLGRGTVLYNYQTQSFEKIFTGFSNFCEISHLDTNAVFASIYFAHLNTSLNFGLSYTTINDENMDPQHYGEPSRCGGQMDQNAAFVAPFWLYETKTAFNTRDSVTFVAPAAYTAGDTINVTSKTAHTIFKTTTPVNLSAGNTLRVPDAVQSRIFLASNCGLWMKAHALDTSSKHDWFKISDYGSYPGVPLSFTATDNGNTVYFGSSSGKVNKLTGLNLIYYTDSLDLIKSDSLAITYSTVDSLQPIEGLAIDPHNDSILICTSPNFHTNKPNVYKSTNGGQSWFPIQAGPVGNPAYTCVIDANNGNNYAVGTEHGVWTSNNAGATWQSDYGDMCDVPVYRLRQIPLLTDDCMVLYAATNSRGLWRSFTLTPAGCNTSVGIKEAGNVSAFHFKVYPNPTSGFLNIEFELPNSQPVQISLLDMQGRKLQSVKEQFTSGKQVYRLNATSLSAGIYFVRVEANGVSDSRKVVIEQ